MKKYIVSVFTDFGRDGHGECGYHEVEVSATNEQTAISEAESIVMGEVVQGSVILECRVLGYYDEEPETENYDVKSMLQEEKMKRFEVLTTGNCFLHGFDEWQDAVTYANSLDIHVKIWDSATGITTEW